MYQRGNGVHQSSLADALQIISKKRPTADQGNIRATNYLAWAYANGDGVKRDGAAAIKLFHKSATSGNARAGRVWPRHDVRQRQRRDALRQLGGPVVPESGAAGAARPPGAHAPRVDSVTPPETTNAMASALGVVSLTTSDAG